MTNLRGIPTLFTDSCAHCPMLPAYRVFKKRQDKLKAQWTHVVGIAPTYFARLRYFFPQTFTHLYSAPPPPPATVAPRRRCAALLRHRCGLFLRLWQKFEPAKIQGWENSGVAWWLIRQLLFSRVFQYKKVLTSSRKQFWLFLQMRFHEIFKKYFDNEITCENRGA